MVVMQSERHNGVLGKPLSEKQHFCGGGEEVVFSNGFLGIDIA